MYAHHMAKVLAYTGRPDVIGKVLAIMPKGDADQPGQIDYMYALRVIDSGWTPEEKQQLIAWFGKASKWRGGSTFSGHLNNIFDASVDVLTDAEKQMAYQAAPVFAPVSPAEIAAAAAGGGRGGGGRGAAAAAAPAAAPGAAPAVAAAPGAAVPGAHPAAGRGGGGGGGGGRGSGLPPQERYDNLVFPRGSGPGILTGRGGGPNAAMGAPIFRNTCASCHKFGAIGASYGPDLTNVGTTMVRRDVLRAIFFPYEKVDARYQNTVLVTRTSGTVRGLLVSEDAQNVVIKTADAEQPMTVAKAQITSRTRENASVMPADIADRVSSANNGDISIAHVVQYLMEGAK
jgi:putative heme-binding domain-containing protein